MIELPETCVQCSSALVMETAEAMLTDDGTLAVLVTSRPHKCPSADGGVSAASFGGAVDVV